MDPNDLRLVRRRCKVCEWEGVQIEPPDADPDCPWCHGPTAATAVLQETVPIVGTPAGGGKNPYAAALGKLGGRKGGKARAASLSKKRRSEIARKAARARWKKTKPTS